MQRLNESSDQVPSVQASVKSISRPLTDINDETLLTIKFPGTGESIPFPRWSANIRDQSQLPVCAVRAQETGR